MVWERKLQGQTVDPSKPWTNCELLYRTSTGSDSYGGKGAVRLMLRVRDGADVSVLFGVFCLPPGLRGPH